MRFKKFVYALMLDGPKIVIANWREDYINYGMIIAFGMAIGTLIFIIVELNREEKRKRKIQITRNIINTTLRRSRINFAELAKKYRVKSKDIKKIIQEHHTSGKIKGTFTEDDQGYIKIQKIKEEIIKR